MKLYIVSEVATILRRNPEVIRRMAREGRLTGSKNGRPWTFTDDDIDAFIESGRQKTSQEKK